MNQRILNKVQLYDYIVPRHDNIIISNFVGINESLVLPKCVIPVIKSCTTVTTKLLYVAAAARLCCVTLLFMLLKLRGDRAGDRYIGRVGNSTVNEYSDVSEQLLTAVRVRTLLTAEAEYE